MAELQITPQGLPTYAAWPRLATPEDPNPYLEGVARLTEAQLDELAGRQPVHLVVARRQHPDGFPSPVAPSHGPSVGDWYIGLAPQEVRAAVREAMRLNVRLGARRAGRPDRGGLAANPKHKPTRLRHQHGYLSDVSPQARTLGRRLKGVSRSAGRALRSLRRPRRAVGGCPALRWRSRAAAAPPRRGPARSARAL